MCLYSRQAKPLKAKKDIIVYKALHQQRGRTEIISIGGRRFEATELTLNARVKHFQYELNKKYTTTLGRVDSYYFCTSKPGSKIEQGFHSYKALRTCKSREGSSSTFVKCVIPKGTLYFEGSNNGSSEGFASAAIVVVEIV
jgi:hypothetical protein